MPLRVAAFNLENRLWTKLFTVLQAENLDEDSSPEQVQWYYRQTRAT